MKPVLFTVVLLGGLTASAVPAQGTSVRPDSARLQGTWAMVSGSANGTPMPQSALAGMRRTLSGNELTVTMDGRLYFKATITLDRTRSPRAIDYQMTGGPTAGAVQRGIYAFAGDTVRFCFGAPNAPRPTDFTSIAGDNRTLSAWVPARP
jgi:uncharacterized protein (TIGR03067 family)